MRATGKPRSGRRQLREAIAANAALEDPTMSNMEQISAYAARGETVDARYLRKFLAGGTKAAQPKNKGVLARPASQRMGRR